MNDNKKNNAEAHWRSQPEYVEHVGKMKQIMLPVYRDATDNTACFGWLWIDDGIVCDQVDCGLRSYCKQTWQLAQVAKAESVSFEKELTYTEIYKKDLVSKTHSKKKNSVNRGKYKNSPLYNRKGYCDQGRLVDRLVTRFKETIGTYETPPSDWRPAKKTVGKVAIKATASYHSLIVNGVIVARIWTDSSKVATIDIVPELVTSMVHLVKSIKSLNDSQKDSINMPTKIPDTCLNKTRPCTHRVSVTTESSIVKVANTIKYRFQF